MKAVLFLLSAWLLLLAGLPCPDTDCHAHETTAATSHSDRANGHANDHKAPCSPFCHCATCLGFSAPQPFGYLLPEHVNEPARTQQLFTYQSPSQTDVLIGIWQPPKL
ncbi:DUF6660 family protein [Spirosoma aerolatum]|uniref:DUF6660 family protein n=1 Tax=Spirosoma aerolatum TaxID=1211326 RepID=UPI0009AC19D0|nr:DUF6660 family protein [Spirosoma aerolatum]